MIWSKAANRVRTERTAVAPSGERDLLSRVGEQDVAAFEALYKMYQPRLVRFLATVLQRSQLVEEVLDDTMMTVWRSAANFRGASKPSTWIFAIAYRKAIKARARWPEPQQEEEFDKRVDPDPRADERLQHQKLGDALRRAMEQLSPEHRAVVDLTYFHGLHYRDIAEIVDCPVDTVKTRMFHARRRLRAAMPGNFQDWMWSEDDG